MLRRHQPRVLVPAAALVPAHAPADEGIGRAEQNYNSRQAQVHYYQGMGFQHIDSSFLRH